MTSAAWSYLKSKCKATPVAQIQNVKVDCVDESVISTSVDIAQCRVSFELSVLTSRESVNLFLMVTENRAIPLEEIYLILIPLLSPGRAGVVPLSLNKVS